MTPWKVPFNKPYMNGKELEYIREAHRGTHLSGDGPFTKRCSAWLETKLETQKALLTHSCTAALEIAALLCNLGPGDEVIMPSFTFVSTANAFVLRGARPVFIDIRPDTLNMNEALIEQAITKNTKAIVPVHYAGVACEMEAILHISKKYGIPIIGDAAQAILSKYQGKPVTSLGEFSTLSFHETKNIISGEGGALLINSSNFSLRAEIIREKGTNRTQFNRGEVAKYTWVDVGSSFLPSELIASFLWAQLEDSEPISTNRMRIWDTYYAAFESFEQRGVVKRPTIPSNCAHNAHLFYLILNPKIDRTQFILKMKEKGIQTVFHYVPLHDSPAGLKYARTSGNLKNTTDLSQRLVRLPLFVELDESMQKIVIESATTVLQELSG